MQHHEISFCQFLTYCHFHISIYSSIYDGLCAVWWDFNFTFLWFWCINVFVSLSDHFSADFSLSAGGHHSHGQSAVAEASEGKGEAEAALSASGKHEHNQEQLHAYIGVSLVLGFVFMLLVDQIGSSHVHNTEGKHSNSLSQSWLGKSSKSSFVISLFSSYSPRKIRLN